jgi:hypothetical protein
MKQVFQILFYAKRLDLTVENAMKQEIVKIKVINPEEEQAIIIELTDLENLSNKLKEIINKAFSESLLIFVGDKNSWLSVETLFRIAQTVHNIVGDSLEWRITDKKPQSMDLEGLSAYLILKPSN